MESWANFLTAIPAAPSDTAAPNPARPFMTVWDCFPDRFTWSWAFANLFAAFAAELNAAEAPSRAVRSISNLALAMRLLHLQQVFSGTLVQVELGDRPRRHDGVGVDAEQVVEDRPPPGDFFF